MLKLIFKLNLEYIMFPIKQSQLIKALKINKPGLDIKALKKVKVTVQFLLFEYNKS
jgi:hypothetical protein